MRRWVCALLLLISPASAAAWSDKMERGGVASENHGVSEFFYHENRPLAMDVSVHGRADGLAEIRIKKLRPFAPQPADLSSWLVSERSIHLTSREFQSLSEALLSLPTLPPSGPPAPGAETVSIHIVLEDGSKRVITQNLETAKGMDALRTLRKLLQTRLVPELLP